MNEGRVRHLILIRHAHRDEGDPRLDNGLSAIGQRQVKTLCQTFENQWLSHGLENFYFLSSPRKRCIETLEPIAQLVGKSVQVDPLLVELEAGEFGDQLVARIDQFMDKVASSKTSYVCCSHGDWIPEFVQMVRGVALPLRKSEMLVFRLEPGRGPRLIEKT